MTPDGMVDIVVDGQVLRVLAGTSVAAAVAQQPPGLTRRSVSGEPRAPVCGMGVCQECRLLVNGRRRLACQTVCVEGLQVNTGTRPGETA